MIIDSVKKQNIRFDVIFLMKELIFLNIGGAGVKIGDKTWQLLSD